MNSILADSCALRLGTVGPSILSRRHSGQPTKFEELRVIQGPITSWKCHQKSESTALLGMCLASLQDQPQDRLLCCNRGVLAAGRQVGQQGQRSLSLSTSQAHWQELHLSTWTCAGSTYRPTSSSPAKPVQPCHSCSCWHMGHEQEA